MESEVSRIHVPAGLAIQTAKLIDTLKVGKPGDVLTDEELSEKCGRDTRPGGDGYGNLQSAIRHAERNHGLVWRRVVGAHSVKCLGSSEIVTVGERDVRGIRRKAARTSRTLRAARLDDLDPKERPKLNATLSQVAAIGMFASSYTTKKIEARSQAGPIDFKGMIEFMKD